MVMLHENGSAGGAPERRHSRPTDYSVVGNASTALHRLESACHSQLPQEFSKHIQDVAFTTCPLSGDDVPVYFPTPLKEQEAGSALKALEACAAAAIADLRSGLEEERRIEVDVDRTACFLMSAYLATIGGFDKASPEVKKYIPDTDLNQAQSILYRRLSANLYETKIPGEYYHIHGSLEATKTLTMLGLPAFDESMTDYRQCIETIEKAVKQYTITELEEMNARELQAGVPALKWEQFQESPHGKVMKSLPPFTVEPIETSTPPTPFPTTGTQQTNGEANPLPQCLTGIRVIELCRVIAGPIIGRSLAAHGAQVLKVTSPQVPDVPFFQLDVNIGKHTTSLHLKDAKDREVFESLLEDADVIVDGYRPGVWARLGYGPDFWNALATRRCKGVVYVVEDCFGGTGVPGAEWSYRPGWQQIADCVTGVAWAQGQFMAADEPVVPPFPISDYGTGILGCVAALVGIWRRATEGGSWMCRTSLVQYDVFLLNLGLYPDEVQARLRVIHDPHFFELRHSDSVDEVGKRAKTSMKRLFPHLFGDKMMQATYSKGFDAQLRWPKEPIKIKGLRVGYSRVARPNGFDPPSWEDWEVDEDVVNDSQYR